MEPKDSIDGQPTADWKNRHTRLLWMRYERWTCRVKPIARLETARDSGDGGPILNWCQPALSIVIALA